MLTIRLPQGTVTADLAGQVGPAGAMVREHGPDGVSAIVQGGWSAARSPNAGVMVQPKVPKLEKAEATAA